MTTTLVIVGSVSACKPLPAMLRALVTRTGGGCTVLHVEDAVADALRSDPVAGVELKGVVDRTARLAPERVWAPLADQALVDTLGRVPAPIAVVSYPHREYDPAAVFPRLRMACESAGVLLVDGRTGKLIRRSPTDHMRAAAARFDASPLKAAIESSVPKAKAS